MASVQETSQLYNASIRVMPGQTRLLRLHRDPMIDSLTADLVVASIGVEGAYLDGPEEHVEYTAISYTWGNGPFSHQITINGVAWRIKESLYDFLHQHRSTNQSLGTGKHLYIWVDALVINQADAGEKSHQVANMIEFYDKASHVQVWLGNAAEHTADAVEFLQHLRADIERKNKVISDDALDGLRDLYNRSWPTRMWIRQEVWAAKSISVQCGSITMPLDVFKAGVVFSKEAGDNLDADAGSEVSDLGIYSSPRTLLWLRNKLNIADTQLSAISFLTQRLTGQQASEDRAVSGLGYKAMEGDGRKSILWLLYESVSYDSTDVRDRIYALIGMCDDPGIEIDYNKTPAEVFTSLARHLILRAGSLDSVLEQDCKYGNQTDLGLPSWVPDWRTLELVRYESAHVTRWDMRGCFDHNRTQALMIRGVWLGDAELVKVNSQKKDKSKSKKKVQKQPLRMSVQLNWQRMLAKLESSNRSPEFSKIGSRFQSIDIEHPRMEPRPGDSLLAVCGSDSLLLLRRSVAARGDHYEFISCVYSDRQDERSKLWTPLLNSGVRNGILETFTIM